MSSSYREFKCRLCREKKTNPCDRDIGICQDCERDLKKLKKTIDEEDEEIKDEEIKDTENIDTSPVERFNIPYESEIKNLIRQETFVNLKHDNAIRSQMDNILNDFFLKKSQRIIMEATRQLEPQILKFISEEVRTQIKDNDYHNFAKSLLKDKLKSGFKEIIEEVVKNIMKNINNTLSSNLEITKKICYSIDTEIKHKLMELPISYETEKDIVNKISQMITNSIPTSKRLIEDKGVKK